MSSQHQLTRLAMRALADAPLDVVEPSKRDADLAIADLTRELARVGLQRRRRRTALFALAAAAALLLAIGMTWKRGAGTATASVDSISGGVMLVRGEHGKKMTTGDSVAEGDRVVALAEGAATLRLRGGTELRAVRGADVLVAQQGPSQLFELRAGVVQLRVAKLQTGERFVVRTGDAEVEVRGTEFSVEVGEACAGSTTRVAVREGTVVVRHAGREARVTANESWPPACGPHASAASSSAPPPAAVLAPAPSSSVAAPSSSAPAPSSSDAPAASAPVVLRPAGLAAPSVNAPARPLAAPSSDLVEENRLFADAIAGKRRGDVPATLIALDRLISAHPTSPLAESAYVERMRVLVTVDRRRAADAARAYLARYPNGYARDEARALTTPQ